VGEITQPQQPTEFRLFFCRKGVQSTAKGGQMAYSASEIWKREHMTARQLLETIVAWSAVLAIAGLVFAGLYLGIASLE
jgi:hypothetical protein